MAVNTKLLEEKLNRCLGLAQRVYEHLVSTEKMEEALSVKSSCNDYIVTCLISLSQYEYLDVKQMRNVNRIWAYLHDTYPNL